jgi:hypothetical protein
VCVCQYSLYLCMHTRDCSAPSGCSASISTEGARWMRLGFDEPRKKRQPQRKLLSAGKIYAHCFFNDVYIYFLLGIFIDHNLSRHVGWYPRHVWLPVQAKELAREAKAKVPRGPEVLLVIEKHMGTTTLNGKKHALDHEYAMISNR